MIYCRGDGRMFWGHRISLSESPSCVIKSCFNSNFISLEINYIQIVHISTLSVLCCLKLFQDLDNSARTLFSWRFQVIFRFIGRLFRDIKVFYILLIVLSFLQSCKFFQSFTVSWVRNCSVSCASTCHRDRWENAL